MSRIGKKPIQIPENVKIFIDSEHFIRVEGPRGSLVEPLNALIQIEQQGFLLHVTQSDFKLKPLHGLYRALIANMIKGVTKGFSKELILTGVGYKAEFKDGEMVMSLGYSHPIFFKIPEGIKATIDSGKTIIKLESINKELLGRTAAQIRSYRVTEPYRGRGIRYSDEIIKRKEGKSKSTGK